MANRLARETSPYLLQHADNPVDWYPWTDEAFERARREDLPILLSIGYSACHWCHVMAHESFEDEATARLMNAYFVNVKLDREERPDLDKVYQVAHQVLARRGGGWPLTVFLTPDDRLPFFAGTYFPKESRHGLPSFRQVLEQVTQWWRERRSEITRQNQALSSFLAEHANPEAGLGGDLDGAPVDEALATLARLHDEMHGGFGTAPKFPHASDLELLFEVATRHQDEGARHIVEHTLERMAAGGIHDQLGGGFARYSVDARWEIPHFEKMLYDNALLLPLYARAAHAFGREDFRRVAAGIVAWLSREMRAPGGGYYAALDADSEGEEGRYYVWRREELRALLDDDTFALAERHFGFDRPANFEHVAWNPICARTVDEVADELGLEVAQVRERLAEARATLLHAREQRVRPGTDEKLLTAWNGLLLSGLARAARHLREPCYDALARELAQSLMQRAWRDGRLYATVQRGQPRFAAYLDDHAFLLEGLLELLRVEFDPRLLDFARTLADRLVEDFEDRGRGGFFFTSAAHADVPVRSKSYTDESMPSGNGAAVRALLALGHLVGEPRWIDAAHRALRAAESTLARMPHACSSLLLGLARALDPPPQIVVRLEPAAQPVWRPILARLRADDVEVYEIPTQVEDAALPEGLRVRAARGPAVAYVCVGDRCLAPVDDPEQLDEALATARAGEMPGAPAPSARTGASPPR